MSSPRLHSDLRTNAQEPTQDGGSPNETAHFTSVLCAVDSGRPNEDRTQTAHGEPQKPHTASDGLPTTASETSDHSQTTATDSENHSQGFEVRQLLEEAQHEFLDGQIAQALTQLAVLPGNVSGTAFERHVASVDRQIPVGKNGRAKGDCSLADFQQRALRVKTVKAKSVLLIEIRNEIKAMTDARRQGWHDLGTVEGRYRAGERAHQVGVAQASREYGKPERSVRRWRQEFRTAR